MLLKLARLLQSVTADEPAGDVPRPHAYKRASDEFAPCRPVARRQSTACAISLRSARLSDVPWRRATLARDEEEYELVRVVSAEEFFSVRRPRACEAASPVARVVSSDEFFCCRCQ